MWKWRRYWMVQELEAELTRLYKHLSWQEHTNYGSSDGKLFAKDILEARAVIEFKHCQLAAYKAAQSASDLVRAERMTFGHWQATQQMLQLLS